ncbi:MAG: RagB/SusD family nutrient uptake outer membrane protein, partial [Lachnospiraceae bacterium]|nr:RagB/SusD family nutrient uptake outer membrane protein [Lachnospiraceae bacterium]
MKSIIKSMTVAALALLSTSCLDLDPKDQLSDGNLWDRAADFQNFANNFYGWTIDFGSVVIRDGQHSDVRSDIMALKGGKNVFANGTNTVPQSDGLYTGNYANIRRCCLLLENAPGFAQQEDIAQYVGEAYFFRAYEYFNLMQAYGDLIIVDHSLDVTDPLMQAERTNRVEVARFIIDDLNNAAAKLKKFSEVPYGRISQEGAYAYLSRVALYEGTWQKFRNNEAVAKEFLTIAADAAKKVIDSKTFELFYNAALGTDSYRYMFILEDVKNNPAGLTKSANKEYIFVRCHDEELKSIGYNISYGTSPSGGDGLASKKFADLFLCDDGLPIEVSPKFQGYTNIRSEWQNRDVRMSTILCPPGANIFVTGYKAHTNWNETDEPQISNFQPNYNTGYNSWKWVGERTATTGKESFDFPIIRYAEVLLNYAEAVYERDGSISDNDLAISINLTRKRINEKMPDLTNAFVTTNGLDMRTE